MARRQELTDEQWAMPASLIAEKMRRGNGGGRPELHSRHAVMTGMPSGLRTDAAWRDSQEQRTSGAICFRRFWSRSGVLRRILEALTRHLEDVVPIDLSECFIDDTVVLARVRSL
jgi:transposase